MKPTTELEEEIKKIMEYYRSIKKPIDYSTAMHKYLAGWTKDDN